MSGAVRRWAPLLLLPVTLLGQDPVSRDDPARPAIPRGLGQLDQDEIALQLRSGSLEIRVLPLDERVTRLLSPDTELSLLALLASRQRVIDSTAASQMVRPVGIVLVTFFAHDNNSSFDPRLLTLVVRSRVVQPVVTVPLSPAFSGQVLDQRQQAMGLLLFEEPLPVTEPFIVEYLDARNGEWERRLPRLDRERARILARLGVTDSSGAD
jgi:hypothetical protein